MSQPEPDPKISLISISPFSPPLPPPVPPSPSAIPQSSQEEVQRKQETGNVRMKKKVNLKRKKSTIPVPTNQSENQLVEKDGVEVNAVSESFDPPIQIHNIPLRFCVRVGTSYFSLPEWCPTQPSMNQGSRNEVLNDTYTCCSTVAIKTSGAKSKNPAEVAMHLCEDERFELDMVIEPALTTIYAFEALIKRMKRMEPSVLKLFRLDESLGGTSAFTHRNIIRRLYGSNMAANDVIESLKTNPCLAVPLVLSRLKIKVDEWQRMRTWFNEIWRQTIASCHLNSLDCTYIGNGTFNSRSSSHSTDNTPSSTCNGSILALTMVLPD